MKGRQWWRSEAPGVRLRRRLLACSAPIAIVLLLTLVKLCSVAVAGDSAASDFAERDAGALRGDVAALNVVNVVEPEKAYFAAGTLAMLGDRLDDADMQFSAALARTDLARSCPARINLELVRETLGDRAARALDTNSAVTRYRSALADVEQAPRGCFTGSTDSDEKRRALLDNAATRLSGKIDAARVAPAGPPPAAGVPPSPPPPPSVASARDQPDGQLRLHPGGGDPLQRLQQILRDAAAARNGR